MAESSHHVTEIIQVKLFAESMEQQVSDLVPAAAVARKLVQSGLTLTQVYNQYASTIEELELRNAECKHLRESLQSIVKKVNCKLNF
jgi:nucleoprotein TPR